MPSCRLFVFSPDASTLADVLTGLDALEINVTLRGDDLDAKPLPIPIMASDDEEGNDVHATEQSDDGKVVAIANSTASTVHAEQRQYLEERNRTLQTALSERTSALHTALARVRELERALEVQQEAATSTATSGTLSLALPFTTASYYSIPHAPSSTSNDANTTITALREEIARLTTAHATECALLRQRAEAERRAFSDARAETRRLLEKLEVMAGTCAQLRGSEGNAGHDDVEMEHLRLELADKELALRELGEAYAKLLRQQHMDEGK